MTAKSTANVVGSPWAWANKEKLADGRWLLTVSVTKEGDGVSDSEEIHVIEVYSTEEPQIEHQDFT